jgi:SAM-dependent methyltransferase
MAAMTPDDAAVWDEEYGRGWLPSSVRDEPSTTVRWALANLAFLGVRLGPGDVAIDAGCGTGRNAVAIATATGARVIGLDLSATAIAQARARAAASPAGQLVSFERRDLRAGLPGDDGSVGLIIDVFASFHLVDPADRAAYLAEAARVLRPDGALLLALAPPDDPYYAACPAEAELPGGGAVGVDPRIGARHVLHTLESLTAELTPAFEVALTWRKHGQTVLDGQTYDRRTLAVLCRPSRAARGR